MAEDKESTITIGGEKGFSGFCPSWFENSLAFLGNKNQFSDMVNIDLIDPNALIQGPGVAALTNGTQAGAVTELIVGILKTITSSDVSFAVSATKLYKISSTTVSVTSPYPITIDKAVVTGEVATTLEIYKSNVYIFYNHSGSAGDIAKLTLATDSLDADWGSTVPTGAGTLQDAPHYTIVSGNDIMYFTNGIYVGYLDGTTLNLTALNFQSDSQAVSLSYNNNRVLIAVNRPNVAGSNFNQSAIYKWNGSSAFWEGDPIFVSGEIGALYTKNGITYAWWKDSMNTGGFSFGYINGTVLTLLRRYPGSLPNQNQIGEYEGFMAWLSSGKLYLWGSKDASTSTKLFQYLSPTYANGGAFAAPFGTLLISSYATTNFILEKKSGYTVSSSAKSMAFKLNQPGYKFQITNIQAETEQMATGARADLTLTYDKAKSTLALNAVAYSSSNPTLHKLLPNDAGPQVEDCRLDISFANGSTTNPVKFRSLAISGYFIKNA